MVRLATLITALAGMSSLVYAAPTSNVQITVQNNCAYSIQVNKLTNEQSTGTANVVAAGKSTGFSVSPTWAGRIWGRKGCTGSTDCQPSAPASLAEFRLSGANDVDYYDVSFVDGFNLPMKIAPNSGTASGYYCGIPACTTLPSCPSNFQVKSGNTVIGCSSACLMTGDCDENKYTEAIKSVCPHVYTYATDDSTSMFACTPSNGFTVTFC